MTNKKLYLIGDPVDHSLSPLLHGAMIAQTGVHYTYEVRRVQPRDLADFVAEAKAGFAAFLKENLPVNPLKCEYYLPTVVTNALEAGKADVHVLTSADKWHGITYREDKPELVAALKQMSEAGLYPTDRLF